ncbi:hypothetical protein QJS04_geneDACA014635 [Acorus gramineus]|uniref:Uncharacterized protein n=1 Tax=Acorus gramineus TaxID=55184 RepID=A0AAV9APZ5_ACOGR|nr:hypothetical protein QJS04_geneDACA014635 [Acorus gramineus]
MDNEITSISILIRSNYILCPRMAECNDKSPNPEKIKLPLHSCLLSPTLQPTSISLHISAVELKSPTPKISSGCGGMGLQWDWVGHI